MLFTLHINSNYVMLEERGSCKYKIITEYAQLAHP